MAAVQGDRMTEDTKPNADSYRLPSVKCRMAYVGRPLHIAAWEELDRARWAAIDACWAKYEARAALPWWKR